MDDDTRRQEGLRRAAALAAEAIKDLGDQPERAAFIDCVVSDLLTKDHPRLFWGDRLLSLDKSMGFFDEPRFAGAYARVQGSHQYDQYASPHSVAWRLHTLVWAAQNGLALDGDFVECGVFKGDFSWVVYQAVQFETRAKLFYLYDTFGGFAPAYSSAEDFPDAPGFFDFADKVYRDPSIYEEVVRKFAPYPNVRIVRGALPDTLADVAPDAIAYLHIDLNSPAAELATLEILFDRVVPGAIIVFDDYGWHVFRKQKEAEDAFMARRGYSILELPTGQGLVVKR